MSPVRKRRWAKRITIVVLCIVALPALALLSMTLGPVRGFLVQRATRALDGALPGAFEIQQAQWGWPARWDFEDITWTRDGEQLLAADRVRIDLRTSALWKRDLILEQVRVDNLIANLPEIKATYRGAGVLKQLDDPGHERQEQPAKLDARAPTLPFLRPGAVSGLPSIEILELSVHVPRAVLSTTDTLTAARLLGNADLLAGRSPRIDIAAAEGALASRGIQLRPGTLNVDLQSGAFEARFGGQLGHERPFTLTSTSSDANAFDLVLRFPANEAEARVHGLWHRRGSRPIALEFDVAAHASDPQKLGLAALRRWAPARVELGGRLELENGLSGTSKLDVAIQQPWFQRAGASLRFAADGFAAESLVVQLDGLALHGDLELHAGELRSELRAHYDGARWLQAFADSLAVPDSLRLEIALNATGKPSQPRVALQVHGALRSGSVPIDSLSLQVNAENGVHTPLRCRAVLEAASHRVALQGVLTLPSESAPLRAELQPLVVRRLPHDPRRADPNDDGEAPGLAVITYDPRVRSAGVEDLRVVGDAGEFEVAGNLDLAAGGFIRATARWPRPPFIANLADSTADALRAAWPRDSIPQIQIDARIAGEGNRFRTQVDGTLQLPGPGRLAALVPGPLDLSGWNQLHGQFHADIGDSSFGHVDLGRTSWIDTCRAEWSMSAGRRALERLQLRLEGVAVDANAALDDDRLGGTLDSRAEHPQLLRRLNVMPDTTSVSWNAHVDLAGTLEAPQLEARVDAKVASVGWVAPAMRAKLALRSGQFANIELTFPEGIAMTQTPFKLDSARVHYDTGGSTGNVATEHWLEAGRLQLELDGPDFGYRQSARIDLHEKLQVHSDRLAIRIQDRELHSVQPFEFAKHANERSFAVVDLLLEGTMGRVSARCETSPDTLALDVEAQLDVPAKPTWLAVPGAAWPTRFELRAQGASHDDVRLAATLTGTQFSQNADVRAELELAPAQTSSVQPNAEPHGFEARLSLVGVDTLVTATALLPFRFEQFPLSAQSFDDSVHIDARWREIPFTVRMPDEGLTAFLDSAEPKPLLSGALRVNGRGVAPDVELDARIDFPMKGASDYSITFSARGNGAGRTRGDLNVRQVNRSIATGHLDVPLRFSFAPFTLDLAEGELEAQLRANSLDLEQLTPVLPAGMSAKGVVVADLGASGPVDDPRLRGSLKVDKLDLETTGRRSLQLDFNSQLSGSWKAPDVSGRLRIVQARLSIPERGSLLPTEGQPLLWDTVDRDSLVQTRLPQPAAGGSLLPVPPDAKVALHIDVPSGFWILGDDLGIELKGDLEAGIEKQTPFVQGRLEAVQGWFSLMGRNFELQSGRCDFDGLDAFNPTLNVEMRTKVKSTTIFVSITGDVEEPKLTLRSEPAMSETDIFGMLVFGHPADQLGSGEGDFLAAQATALAQSYSGAALQQVLGKQLGVDTVRFKSGSEDGDNTGTSLEVGKYIRSNVLLHYELDLQTGRGRAVRMEYRISDRLKLDSHLGHERSGVEFNWGRDY